MSGLSIISATMESVAELSKQRQEPKWLREFRIKSFQLFQKLPVEQSQLYTKYVDLSSLNLESIYPYSPPQKSEKKIDEAESSIPSNQRGFTMVHVDGAVSKADLPSDLAQTGLIFEDLTSAIAKDPDYFKPYFLEKAILPEEDKFIALNNALFSSGIFLYIPKGLEVRVPFRNVNFVNGSGRGLFSQTLIIVEPGSKVSFVEEGYSLGGQSTDRQSVQSSVTEIYLREGGETDFANFQGFNQNVVSLSGKRAICEKDSKISWTIGYLGSGSTRSKIDSVLQGQGASAEDLEIVFANGNQRFDLSSNLIHRGPNTNGHMMAKGVVKDTARVIFKGLIRIEKPAKNSNAYLAEHGMLLSREARSDAIPSLEIETNEVKATHSASVSQVDPEQIFYLTSRGLSDEEAKKALVVGFFDALIRRIPHFETRERVRALVELKWLGAPISGALKGEAMELYREEHAGEELGAQRDIFEGHYKYR